jgi:serine/threonine-protein kinase/endoribonuclease IRE1
LQIGHPLKYSFSEKSLLLGTGCSGTSVYAGVMADDSEVAVKRMLKEACEETAENEAEILKLVNTKKSPFIVSYRKFLKDDTFMYLIIDVCEETLKDYVPAQSTEHLKEYGSGMINEILSGLLFLHRHRILHRDLKPSNVLVDVKGKMRLADFGLSRILREDETTVKTEGKGSDGWMAAEVIESRNKGIAGRFKKKSDVQAAGMISFFILTQGDHPFGPWLHRMANILKGNAVNLENLENVEAREFVSLLISREIDDRPYAGEALAHSFIRQAKCFEGHRKPTITLR